MMTVMRVQMFTSSWCTRASDLLVRTDKEPSAPCACLQKDAEQGMMVASMCVGGDGLSLPLFCEPLTQTTPSLSLSMRRITREDVSCGEYCEREELSQCPQWL